MYEDLNQLNKLTFSSVQVNKYEFIKIFNILSRKNNVAFEGS